MKANDRSFINLYIDDSGTRHPNHAPPTSTSGDWFALGGILIKAEEEDFGRQLHAAFVKKWSISAPLHSVKIRHKSGDFSWLSTVNQKVVREFYSDLDHLMLSHPGVATGCVIHRPGYHARYFERYGRRRWHLCKTAFSVVCERAAKYAQMLDRRVKVFVEETDRKTDERIRTYFAAMREAGMPFASNTSEKYQPLTPDELRFRLIDLKFKRKSSPPMQMADLYLYPMCRAPYDEMYRPALTLRKNGKLIDSHLDKSSIGTVGIKYSCFD